MTSCTINWKYNLFQVALQQSQNLSGMKGSGKAKADKNLWATSSLTHTTQSQNLSGMKGSGKAKADKNLWATSSLTHTTHFPETLLQSFDRLVTYFLISAFDRD